MAAIRFQFMLSFAVMGCLLPYLPTILKERGLDARGNGLVFAAASAVNLLTPVLLTWLADGRRQTRWLIAAVALLAALSLTALYVSTELALIAATYAAFSLAFAPVMPLQDSMVFHHQQQCLRQNRHVPSYHKIRVFGTIGFIVPNLGLYFWLKGDSATDIALLVATGACLLAVVNSAFLPRRDIPDDLPRRIPTVAAATSLLRPKLLLFCLAMFLIHNAAAGYYNFHPLYLHQDAGIPKEWVGPVINIGVAIEILFMLAFGRLRRRLGLRWLAVLGMSGMAARLALLAAFPNIPVAIATQGFHGLMVLMLHVVPPVLLDQNADDHFRSSIQGLFAIAVSGVGRITGSLIAGELARWSLTGMFAVFAGTCIVAALLVTVSGIEDSKPPMASAGAAPGDG